MPDLEANAASFGRRSGVRDVRPPTGCGSPYHLRTDHGRILLPVGRAGRPGHGRPPEETSGGHPSAIRGPSTCSSPSESGAARSSPALYGLCGRRMRQPSLRKLRRVARVRAVRPDFAANGDSGPAGGLRLHRRQLQPAPATLGPQIRVPPSTTKGVAWQQPEP